MTSTATMPATFTLGARLTLGILAATPLALLGACRSEPASNTPLAAVRAHDPLDVPTPDAGHKTIYLSWKAVVPASELNDLKKRFLEIAAERKYTITDAPEKADRHYMVTLRFFDWNPNSDRGNSVLKTAGDVVTGGETNWVKFPEGTPIEASAIKSNPIVLGDKSWGPGDMFSKQVEFDLLIDVAVGVKSSADGPRNRHTARIIGWAQFKELDKKAAAKLLLDNCQDCFESMLPE